MKKCTKLSLLIALMNINILRKLTQGEITIPSMDWKQENMLFGTFFGHCGGHLEYAKAPNLNHFLSTQPEIHMKTLDS